MLRSRYDSGRSKGAHNPARERPGLQPSPVDEHPVLVLDGIGAKVAGELEEGIPCLIRNKQLVRNCKIGRLLSLCAFMDHQSSSFFSYGREEAIPDRTLIRGWHIRKVTELVNTYKLCTKSGTSLECSCCAPIPRDRI